MSSPPSRAPRWRIVAAAAVGVFLAFAFAYAAVRPFLMHQDWMTLVQDDFFYYLKVAQNLAAGHGSTFNGLVATNGYHPLWLWVITLVLKLGAGHRGIGIFLASFLWLATVLTYLLCMQFLRNAHLEPLTASLLAAYVAVNAWGLFCLGMEVTLAIPLLLALILFVQSPDWWLRPGRFWQSLCVGLLISAACLARLDALVLVALLAVGCAFVPAVRNRFRLAQLTGTGLGLLPLLLYFLSNRIYFGIWMPVSGMAKELKLDHGFTAPAWSRLFNLSHPTHLINPALIILALLLLPRVWSRLTPLERAFAPAVLAFPFLYLAILSWLSDWFLWRWYFYSFPLALCVAFLIFVRFPAVHRVAIATATSVVLALFIGSRILAAQWYSQFPDILGSARHLRQFAATHPGIYAMGDRSGMVAYLLPDPVVQTEGLMMDRAFLNHIKQQEPLRAVLATYGVRYYIGTSFGPYTGCFHAAEPMQAGPHAPKMRAVFCAPPIDRWTADNGVETMVFDLKPGPIASGR